MIYEQYTIDGTIEIIDELNGNLLARRLVLTCEKDCILCGERFMEGEQIEVTLSITCELGSSSGRGPWEPGGFSSQWVRHNAIEIIELSREKTLYRRR